MLTSCSDHVRDLLHPRDYYCGDCGPLVENEYIDILESVCWNPETKSYEYNSDLPREEFPWVDDWVPLPKWVPLRDFVEMVP